MPKRNRLPQKQITVWVGNSEIREEVIEQDKVDSIGGKKDHRGGLGLTKGQEEIYSALNEEELSRPVSRPFKRVSSDEV